MLYFIWLPLLSSRNIGRFKKDAYSFQLFAFCLHLFIFRYRKSFSSSSSYLNFDFPTFLLLYGLVPK
jgi:hypothetical protein